MLSQARWQTDKTQTQQNFANAIDFMYFAIFINQRLRDENTALTNEVHRRRSQSVQRNRALQRNHLIAFIENAMLNHFEVL